MAAFTTLAVSNKTPNGVTLTFNAASVDLNVAQVRQLRGLLMKLIVDVSGNEGGNASAVVTGA